MAIERGHTGLELYNRYRVGPLEAQGALCAVFRGDDTVLRRPIVVKAVPPTLAETYRDALRACAALSHPAIVATYDAVRLDGWLYLVQEFVAAQPLASYLDAGLPIARAVDLAAQIARVLVYAHAHSVTHGDLTPAAVLVDRRAAVRINNFGLPPDAAYFARAGAGMDDGANANAPLGADADSGGMPATGSAEKDVRALGLILWQALSAPARSAQAENEPLDAERTFRADVPEGLRALVRRCAGRSRDERIVDAETALAELDTIADELAQARAPLAEQTPPTIRAARAAIARVASWSADETQAGQYQWGDNDGSHAHSAPTIASSRYPSSGPLAVDAAPRLRLPARATGAPGAPGVRGAPPSSPGLRQRATAGPSAPLAPLGLVDPPTWPSQQRRTIQASINFRMLLVVSVALFVLFFIIGFIAQPGIGLR